MPLHYTPGTKTTFLRDIDVSTLGDKRVGLVAFSRQRGGLYPLNEVRILSATGDLNEVTHGLFAALYELDQLGLDMILVDTCEERGLGMAIMNRLKRAVAQ
ncbi:hypothetical protein JNK13_07155 [bacterium]|nr:hypothetical protein [bacterium]